MLVGAWSVKPGGNFSPLNWFSTPIGGPAQLGFHLTYLLLRSQSSYSKRHDHAPYPLPTIRCTWIGGAGSPAAPSDRTAYTSPAVLSSPLYWAAEIIFSPDAAPQPRPVNLSSREIDGLEKPNFLETWPIDELVADMDALQVEYGTLVGDLNTDGLLNAAYHLYGAQLYTDFYDAPERVHRLMDVIADLIVDVALYVRERTGSCSISVNRMVERVDPSLFLHANCSVQMISLQCYREFQLPVEKRMATRIQPYGIHHCGDNLHKIASAYAELAPAFVDVGWGSDVAICRNESCQTLS